MGVLANHVPTVEPLRPGVIEVIESAGDAPKKFFGAHALFAHSRHRFLTVMQRPVAS
jgi:F-type H+-transporting ATPase subunit delta